VTRDRVPDGESSQEEVLRVQARSNQRADEVADLYTGHRTRLTAAVAALAPPARAGRLCLLGAGNCRDVDLVALGAAYREIHLVDLDERALDRAQARHDAGLRERLTKHAPVDLSGLLGVLDRWRKTVPSGAEIDTAVDRAARDIGRALPAGFDAVVSCCVLTQMLRTFTQALGTEHPRLPDVRRALATIHLRTLVSPLDGAGGARALFAGDVVSNETYPLDDLPPGQNLADLLPVLAREGNFFLGTQPAHLAQILRRDPWLSAHAGPARPLEPWLWKVGPERTFLVYGFVLGRK
jgi:hypothetical protein